MHQIIAKRVIALVFMLAVTGLGLPSIGAAPADNDNRGPELPIPLCDTIQVPAGNKVSSHVYALGVQVYRWNGTSWVFVGPVANLYADHNYRGQVGTHYGGPTWESNSGSRVEARRVAGTGCTPDPTAIPWLLLSKHEASGPGIFSRVTYIQRVHTVGGIAPSMPGLVEGEVKEVPYTAEYYFYRAEN